MRAHYDFSNGVRGKYAGKVNTDDIHRFRGTDSDNRAAIAKDKLFVEQRPGGDYAIRRSGSERASAVEPTQAEAISRARELSNGGTILVERVRNTSVGVRDKWRKP